MKVIGGLGAVVGIGAWIFRRVFGDLEDLASLATPFDDPPAHVRLVKPEDVERPWETTNFGDSGRCLSYRQALELLEADASRYGERP